jgi:protein SCO1
MKKPGAIIILLLILVVPSLTLLGHCGRPKSEMVPLRFIKMADPAGGRDSVYRGPGNFSFTSQWGYPVTQDTVANKIYVANVFFSTCNATCPRIMATMQQVQKYYAGDPFVKIVSFSVDPETDSVARLAVYGDSLKCAKGQWYLLTGNKSDLYKFETEQMMFQAMEDSSGEVRFVHDSRVRLIDWHGRMRGKFPLATESSSYQQIINEIEQLKAEYATEQR